MGFETHELAEQTGSKIALYTMTIGSTIYRMHDSVELTIGYGGDTFYRTQVGRGNIQTGQEFLELTLPGGHDFPITFAAIAPGQTAALTIQEYHRADPADVRVVYKGVVRSVAFQENASKSVISLVPINEAFDKMIPERTFQAQCNHILFDAICQVSAGSYSFTGTVTNVTNNLVTVGGLTAAKGNGWSTGGYVRYGTLDYRLILEQSSDVLTLVLPFHESVLGQSVSVYAGCDHSIATCNSKFSNATNFGGYPYVPTKNIFLTGLQ